MLNIKINMAIRIPDNEAMSTISSGFLNDININMAIETSNNGPVWRQLVYFAFHLHHYHINHIQVQSSDSPEWF